MFGLERFQKRAGGFDDQRHETAAQENTVLSIFRHNVGPFVREKLLERRMIRLRVENLEKEECELSSAAVIRYE